MSVGFVGSDSVGADSGGSVGLVLPPHSADHLGLIFTFGDETGSWSISGATGWTKLVEYTTSSGATHTTALFYKKFTSGSESDPTANYDQSTQQISASVHVFSGVDPTDPWGSSSPFYSRAEVQNDVNPPNQSILTDQDNSAIVVFHGATHNEISSAGAPSGYTLGEALLGVYRNNITAYLLDSGTAGSKQPGDWTHSGAFVYQDNTVWTIALNPYVEPPPESLDFGAKIEIQRNRIA